MSGLNGLNGLNGLICLPVAYCLYALYSYLCPLKIKKILHFTSLILHFSYHVYKKKICKQDKPNIYKGLYKKLDTSWSIRHFYAFFSLLYPLKRLEISHENKKNAQYVRNSPIFGEYSTSQITKIEYIRG